MPFGPAADFRSESATGDSDAAHGRTSAGPDTNGSQAERSRVGVPALVLFDRDGTLIDDVPYNGDPTGPQLGRDIKERFRWRVAVAVNLHGVGPCSTRSLRSLEACRLMAFRPPRRPRHEADPPRRDRLSDTPVMGPLWWPKEHEVRRWCRLLAHWGVHSDPDDLSLVAPPLRDGLPVGATVIHPGAAAPARRWPPDRFAQVASALAAAGLRVVLTGDSSELELCNRVADLVDGRRRPTILAGATSWGDLSALITRARLVVCNDTGVAHLATAHRTPSVVLFGPTSPREWGPARSGPHVALWSGTTGDPHGHELDPGLARIEVNDVLDAIIHVTAELTGTPGHDRGDQWP